MVIKLLATDYSKDLVKATFNYVVETSYGYRQNV